MCVWKVGGRTYVSGVCALHKMSFSSTRRLHLGDRTGINKSVRGNCGKRFASQPLLVIRRKVYIHPAQTAPRVRFPTLALSLARYLSLALSFSLRCEFN